MNKNSKKGSFVMTTPIIITISLLIIIIIGVYVVSLITPFILYEKLNNVALKYMFIVEKYGYLTQQEEENLLNELESKGFLKEKINIIVPKTIKKYGELVELKLSYSYVLKTPVIIDTFKKFSEKAVDISICKSSYCKR